MSDKAERFYGPLGKAGWDAIEAEIERQCEAAGISAVDRYSLGFDLNPNTGEIKMQPIPEWMKAQYPKGNKS